MTEHEWLDACANHPDDDMTRFAFADWLEESGDDARAEFIRLQVMLSGEVRNDSMSRRADELLGRHHERWLGPLVSVAPAKHWEFHRGLPERLYLYEERLDCADMTRLTSSPYLARVTNLEMAHNQIGDEGAGALACCPMQDGIERAVVSRTWPAGAARKPPYQLARRGQASK
jgi:uncharacterized protein (TIGR02996 family)